MRSPVSRFVPAFLAVLVFVACSDSTSPRWPVGDEVPRGDWQIFLERASRTSARSYYMAEPDGSRLARIDGLPDDALAVMPSPDGSRFAALRIVGPDVHLWIMDRFGGNRRSIREGTVVVHSASWSPDGTRIVAELSTLDDASDIWIFDVDDGGATQITFDLPNAALFDRNPAWSPDGARIAMTSNRSGTMRLWIMNADGSGLEQVNPTPAGTEDLPVWSPDGSRIAFWTGSTEGEGIGTARPDGSDFRLYPFDGEIESIAWAPDGRVLFTALVDLDYDLYALNPETGSITPLSSDPEHELRVSTFGWTAPPAWRGFATAALYQIDRPDPRGVAVADVTADGNPDVLLLAPAFEEIRLLRGTGNGQLEPFGGLTAPDDQRAVAVGDVSRDEVDDIIVLGASALHVWRGSVAGPGVATTHAFDGDARGLVTADFDEDGSMDVVAIHERPAGFALMAYASRHGDGELVAVVDHQTGFHDAGAGCAGDVTGDGWDDIVIPTGTGASPVVMLRGRADGTFAEAVIATSAVNAVADAIPVCVDLDGDRRSDLVLLDPGSEGGLYVLFSRGNGFNAAIPLAVRGTAIAAADIDRDGDVDLVITGASGPGALFVRNTGTGALAIPVSIPVGGTPRRLAIADLDGDAWPDLVIADESGAIRTLRNRGR